MPAASKSQQRLFGMVKAYQSGQIKNPPGKIKEVASNVSPESVDHFASTKRRGLPNKVKKAELKDYLRAMKGKPFDESKKRKSFEEEMRDDASDFYSYKHRLRAHKDVSDWMKHNKTAGWWEDFKTDFDSGVLNGHHPHEEGARMLGKKEAFDIGFMKAAIDQGVNPLVAIKFLKTAFDFANTGEALGAMGRNASPENIIPGALLGAGIGGLGGALSSKDHKLRNGLLGAGLGGALGGASNLAMDTNTLHDNSSKWLGNMVQDARKLEKTDPSYTTPEGVNPISNELGELHKGISNSSFLKSLLGQQPLDPNVNNMMSRSPVDHYVKMLGHTPQYKLEMTHPSPETPAMNPQIDTLINSYPNVQYRE